MKPILTKLRLRQQPFVNTLIPNGIKIYEQLRRHRWTDWRGLHTRRSFLLRRKRQKIGLFKMPGSLFTRAYVFRSKRAITREFVRMCTLCPFNFLFSFSFYPSLACLRSALWLPWRHSKLETNYSSPAAAPLLCLEHPLRLVAPLLFLFIALSCMMFCK